MRNITLTLYLYDELPTDKAKSKARDWMLQALRETPNDSDYRKVVNTLKGLSLDQIKEALPTQSQCTLTGFYADHDALAAAEKYLDDLEDGEDVDMAALHRAVTDAIDKVWDDEQDSWSETDYLEDMIRGNDYEFTEDGKRAVYPK